jgi:hypothetical protein
VIRDHRPTISGNSAPKGIKQVFKGVIKRIVVLPGDGIGPEIAACAEFTIVPVELLLSAIGTSNARRLCPLDTNLLQCPNSPGTEEPPR